MCQTVLLANTFKKYQFSFDLTVHLINICFTLLPTWLLHHDAGNIGTRISTLYFIDM